MNHHSEYPAMCKLKARAWFDGKPQDFKVKGQAARTLAALITAKQKGVTAFEISSWALRLSQYISVLRHKHKLEIETLEEEHPGGWHGRYVLHTPVEILDGIFE